jgi:general secretion pathway protein F
MDNSGLSISSTDKLNLMSNIATMLTAGIPILETVDTLLDESKGNTKKILQQLKDDLMQGQHIYISFAQFPRVFDKVTINIIKASEEAGTLNTTLRDLREQIKKDMEFVDKIRGALTYPFLIILVFIAIVLMILIVVIPKISTVFMHLNVVLPLPTKILIFLSSTLLTYPIPITLGAIVILVIAVYFLRRYTQFFLRILYLLPVVSTLIKQIDLTRFSHSMYLLLSSGIIITTALELTSEVVQRRDVREAIIFARETVLAGKDLSEGFKKKNNVFSSIMIKIIEAGEKTGTLDKSMQDIAEHYEYEVSNSLKTLTALLEPLMLVIVGLLVGGMMLSIIAPIYQLIGQVGATH